MPPANKINTFRPNLRWGRAPLLFPLLAFGAGIILAKFLDYSFSTLFLLAGLSTLLLGGILHLRPRPGRPFNLAHSVVLLLALFFVGGWYASERHPPNQASHFSHLPANYLEATVTHIKPAARTLSVELAVTAVYHDKLARPATGKLLVYLPPDERAGSLEVGHRIALAARYDTVAAALNPYAFDYAGYLADQNIFHRAFPRSPGDWQLLGDKTSTLTVYAERSRRFWFGSLQPYLSGDRLAVAAALIMGKRDLLDARVRSAYADTGAIHVLAVSGLHVGILALIVSQLLGFLLPVRPGWKILRSVITVALVWYFALVVGFSPSVQRAALMVTVVLLGTALQRNNGIFNLLAIAALLMLVLEPKQLFQVGFQLSFAAVAGIALFARTFGKLIYTPWKFLKVAWSSVAVSTAAQLGTLPLSLYYFRQFPLYFMVSGTVVILFAYLVLGLGLLHGFLAAIGLHGNWLLPTGTLLNWVVEVQNAFIFYCGKLPGATLKLASFGWLSALGLALLIGNLAYLSYRPSHRGRWFALGLSGLLLTAWSLHPVLFPPPPQFAIFHAHRASLIDVFDGESGVALGDSIDVTYSARPLRERLDYQPGVPVAFEEVASLPQQAVAMAYPFLRLLDCRVLVLDENTSDPISSNDLSEVDLILATQGVQPKILGGYAGAVPVVVDGSNPQYLHDDWKALNLNLHLTAEQGAYRYFLRQGN